MTRERNDQIFGVWIEHFDAMALKTVAGKGCRSRWVGGQEDKQ
jgi:recombinational DNA repair protein RecT